MCRKTKVLDVLKSNLLILDIILNYYLSALSKQLHHFAENTGVSTSIGYQTNLIAINPQVYLVRELSIGKLAELESET